MNSLAQIHKKLSRSKYKKKYHFASGCAILCSYGLRIIPCTFISVVGALEGKSAPRLVWLLPPAPNLTF